MKNIFNNIDKAVILTLDKRINMSYELYRQVSNLDINVEMFIVGKDSLNKEYYDLIDSNELPPKLNNSIDYPTWYLRPNAYNAWKGHRAIFKKAIADNLKSILMLEDDAFLEDDFIDIYQLCLEFINTNNWDIIYFGGYHRPGSWAPTTNKNIIKVNGSGGLHGCLLKKHIIEELLLFEPTGPVDWQIGTFLHSIYNCYAIFPSIISQRDRQFSYVEGTELTKPSRFIR